MFLCDGCPAFIKDVPIAYSCNVLPRCMCRVYGERQKPVMVCPKKDTLKGEKGNED